MLEADFVYSRIYYGRDRWPKEQTGMNQLEEVQGTRFG